MSRKRLLMLGCFAGLLAGCVFLWLAVSEEHFGPTNYATIRLGMEAPEVTEILGPVPNPRRGFAGHEKDKQENADLAAIQRDKWGDRFRDDSYLGHDWAIQVVYDQKGIVVGKILYQVDSRQTEGTWFNTLRRWLRWW